MTFHDASKEFELDCKVRHLSPKTIGNYTKQLRYLENFLSSEFSVLNIEDVKPAHIKSFMAKMDDAGRKPQYINDLLKVFKTFFTYLETEGYIKVSPAKRIRNMKLPKLKLRTFTEKNILDMIDFYSGQSFVDIRNRAMIALMFDTGVRLSELMEMIESQIHEDSIMIYGKGAKERVVPVSPFLEKALLRYSRARESYFQNVLHDKEFFLSRTGKKLTAEAVAKMLKKAADAVGVSKEIRVSPHTCRHTFAHLNLKNGIDLYTLSRLLGHESVSIIKNSTVLVLKKPKTETSNRKVFLPKTVAEMLVAWKMDQDATIQALGDEYMKFNLVIATPLGMPTESSVIRRAMKDLIEENNLPPVVFHSLRHSSITYKLKLTGGDIKAVQGDSGHAQAAMVTDQYSHILDENRRTNAELIEKAFYAGKGSEPDAPSDGKKEPPKAEDPETQEGMSPEKLAKLLTNPEVINMLKVLSKSLES